MARHRVVMTKWSTPEEHGGRAFDRAFWQAAGATARIAASWQLVVDQVRMKGGDETQLRLQRHLARLVIRRTQDLVDVESLRAMLKSKR